MTIGKQVKSRRVERRSPATFLYHNVGVLFALCRRQATIRGAISIFGLNSERGPIATYVIHLLTSRNCSFWVGSVMAAIENLFDGGFMGGHDSPATVSVAFLLTAFPASFCATHQ